MTVRCLRADKNKAGQGIILSPVRLHFLSLFPSRACKTERTCLSR
ncbi:hypothetical protein CL3_30310 [butyrate-producing bacterium SM4/1]|nr:hypothetical protein CL3_30310 [butyrate-producing bacterium SM4/1]